MLSIDEWRKVLGRDDLSDEEIAAFLTDLRAFLDQILDDFFRDEFDPEDV